MKFLRLTPKTLTTFLKGLLTSLPETTKFRKCSAAEERLAITLRMVCVFGERCSANKNVIERAEVLFSYCFCSQFLFCVSAICTQSTRRYSWTQGGIGWTCGVARKQHKLNKFFPTRWLLLGDSVKALTDSIASVLSAILAAAAAAAERETEGRAVLHGGR